MTKIPYPKIARIRDKRVKISEQTKQDIIKLRKQDPNTWTYQKLADLYQISRQSAGRICDPEQRKRANESTTKCIMRRWKNDPKFRKRETDRVKEYLKKRETNSEEYKKYHKQFKKQHKQSSRQKPVRKTHAIMVYTGKINNSIVNQ
jgi:hypothetical protein